jgi:hypothetical protein
MPTLEPRITRPACEKTPKGRILITQALGEAGRGYLRKPLVPRCAFPPREPCRQINPGKGQSAFSVGLAPDLQRGVPQPAYSAQPTIEQTPLSTIWIGADLVASRDGSDVNIMVSPLRGLQVHFGPVCPQMPLGRRSSRSDARNARFQTAPLWLRQIEAVSFRGVLG